MYKLLLLFSNKNLLYKEKKINRSITKVRQSWIRIILGWIRALGNSKYRWHTVANDDNDHGRQL